MKKSAFVALAFALFTMIAAVAPALAAPAEKTSFTAKQILDTTQPPSPDLRIVETEGDTVHVRNQLGAGKLWISPNAPPSAPTGTTSSTIMLNVNRKTGEGEMKLEMMWTIGEGTCEGNIIGKMVGPPFASNPNQYNVYAHGVLQGKGSLEGQTILLEGTRLLGQPWVWTGTIVTK